MVSKHPKVSIGLPVYNGEKYLRESLDSILAQTYQDFELVICDNASTDATQKICLEYAQRDPRVRYYRNEKNLGAAPNHNLVFKLSEGEYFKWFGYDDKIAPEFLSECVKVLDENPGVVLCMPNSILIDESGQYLGDYTYKADANFPDPKKRFRNFILRNESGNYVYGLMRRESVAKTALQGSFTSSDLVFISELTLYGAYFIVSEPLFYRRSHSEQSTKGALSLERSRSIWFDTSLESKIVLPKWQCLFGYLRAVKNAPLTISQRVYCYAQVVRWVLILPHLRALIKDVLLAAKKFIFRSYAKLDRKLAR